MEDDIHSIVQRVVEDSPRGAGTNQVAVALLAAGAMQSTVWSREGVIPNFRENSRYLVYSITKTIVAATFLKFVAASRVKLDETLERWLPEFPLANQLRLRSVLLHTSGLPNYGALETYHAAVRAGEEPWSEEEFLRRTNAHTLLFERGEQFCYSNIGYMLLRRVLERIGGGDLQTVLQREVFAPLGITTASVPLVKADLRGFEFGLSAYLGGEGPPRAVAEHYDPQWISTGVVGMSIQDLAWFMEGAFSTLLPPEVRGEWTRVHMRFGEPDATSPWRAPAYGLGLAIDWESPLGPAFGHLGGGPGCSPAVRHFPQANPPLTLAVVTDGENDLPQHIIVALAETYRDRPS